MVKSIVVAFVSFGFCTCVVGSSDYSSESNNLVTCAKVGNEYPCCDDGVDVCGRRHQIDPLGEYLNYPALSNGACTGGGSGAYQCATFAQGLWIKFNPLDGNGRPIPVFTKRWLVAARALQCASTEEGLFIFRNGSSEPPRETDILVYLNVGQNEPANCNPNFSQQELNALYAHPGHVSVVSGVTRNDNGRVTHLNLIEENLVLPPEVQACDDNLSDARMRTVTVSFRDGRYFVDSGVSSLEVIGWIRHNLAGIFADEGWHEDNDDGIVDGHSISQSFRAVYARWDKDFLGWSRDNGGTPFVHTRNGHLLQDFVTSEGLGRALVYNPNLGATFLIRDGFYNLYLGMEGTTGLPLDEEHPGSCLSVQNFENGYLCWSGWAVYWFSNGVLPPPRVEPEPPLDNSDSNGESDPESPPPEESEPEEANSPPECYANDWLPCYTGSISTQNIGLCQGGRVLCVNGHWQWNECVGEITPSPENCLDGLDNDCDSLTDCLDVNCAGSPGCPADLGGSEEFEIAGGDEQDQDNCDFDQDGYQATSCGGDDCNDRNSSIHPGVLEALRFDWIDADCNGRDAPDADGDLVVTMEDCDDLDALQYPGAPEVCNGEDDNCDELIDEGVCPVDTDNDSFFDSDDCSPEDPLVFPGAPESCNYRDDNCDGAVDEGVKNRCGSCGSEPEERCADLMDNDCDGVVDELDACPPNPDFDGDGTLDVSDNCPDTYNQGQSDIDGDHIGDACDSRDDRIFPPEVCDGVDNDNDGTADDGYECLFNSWADCLTECGSSGRKHCASNCTWSSCFPQAETCWNSADDDCDGYESEDCGALAGAWCSGANLITNYSFENSLNGWTLEVRDNAQAEMLQDCSTAQDGECALRVVVGRQGHWEDIVLGTNLNLVSGNEYQIRLYTRKRDENAGDAPQILISSGDGVNNVGVWSQCTVTDGWNQCAIRFRARDSVSGYRLLILLGHISGEVLLDELRVVGCG